MLNGRALLVAASAGTVAQVAMVLAGHYSPAVKALFAVGGMGLSLLAGLAYGLTAARVPGSRAGSLVLGGLLAGAICALLGIFVSYLLGDVPATLLALGTCSSAVTGALGGALAWLIRRPRAALTALVLLAALPALAHAQAPTSTSPANADAPATVVANATATVVANVVAPANAVANVVAPATVVPNANANVVAPANVVANATATANVVANATVVANVVARATVVPNANANVVAPATALGSTADFAWLAGRWQGRTALSKTALAEVMFAPPAAGLVTGVMRLTDGEKVLVVELITLVDTPNGPEMRYRHFAPDLTAYEKDFRQSMRLTTLDAAHAVFENQVAYEKGVMSTQPRTSTFIRTGPDSYVAHSDIIGDNGQPATIEVTYRRAP